MICRGPILYLKFKKELKKGDKDLTNEMPILRE